LALNNKKPKFILLFINRLDIIQSYVYFVTTKNAKPKNGTSVKTCDPKSLLSAVSGIYFRGNCEK
jgi:hypothetical protein